MFDTDNLFEIFRLTDIEFSNLIKLLVRLVDFADIAYSDLRLSHTRRKNLSCGAISADVFMAIVTFDHDLSAANFFFT